MRDWLPFILIVGLGSGLLVDGVRRRRRPSARGGWSVAPMPAIMIGVGLLCLGLSGIASVAGQEIAETIFGIAGVAAGVLGLILAVSGKRGERPTPWWRAADRGDDDPPAPETISQHTTDGRG